MFLSCKPAVTIINEDYEILLCTKENGIISIEINQEIYREENSGVLYSEKNYAKIRVPQKVLDKSKKYTVVFNKILNRTAYFSKLGEEIKSVCEAGAAFVDADAGRGIDADLRGGVHALGVRTPFAVQRAAFQEDLGADAGSVVDGVALDVINEAFCLGHSGSP